MEALTNETLRVWVNRWCGGDTRYYSKALPHISTWDTSQVTDMAGLFGRTSLNENDDVEDTSCVLLADLPLFNDDISAWDTSHVTTMEKMFLGQSSFNQPLNDWRVDNVTNMSQMFAGASSFNHPIGGWRVHNVWNMRGMFHGASSFNQPLGDWRVHRVRDMKWMFKDARSFNQPLCGWWVQQVRTMQAMFQGAESMVEPNVLYSAFKWFQPTRGRLADQWWADRPVDEDRRPKWQLGDPWPGAEPDVLSDERIKGVVVDTRREFYFVRGENGDNLLLHMTDAIVDLTAPGRSREVTSLAVGDWLCYVVRPASYADHPYYRLECANVARVPPPDEPDSDGISFCAIS
jgi:surface protein